MHIHKFTCMFSLICSLYDNVFTPSHTYLANSPTKLVVVVRSLHGEDTKSIVHIEGSTEVPRDSSNHFSLLVGQSIVHFQDLFDIFRLTISLELNLQKNLQLHMCECPLCKCMCTVMHNHML